IAFSDSKHIQEVTISEQERENETKIKVNYGDIIIKAIPTNVTRIKDPVSQTIRYEIEFETSTGDTFKIGPLETEHIVVESERRGLVYKPRVAKEYFDALLNGYYCLDRMTLKDEVTTEGFYYLDGKIVVSKLNLKEPPKEQLQKALDFLEGLRQRTKRVDALAHCVKWAIVAPFSFVRKQLGIISTKDWVPNTLLDGESQVGKSEGFGRVVVLGMWRKHTKKDEQTY